MVGTSGRPTPSISLLVADGPLSLPAAPTGSSRPGGVVSARISAQPRIATSAQSAASAAGRYGFTAASSHLDPGHAADQDEPDRVQRSGDGQGGDADRRGHHLVEHGGAQGVEQ